ncbi:MAG: thiamine-phosphate kinase [Abditibacteriaceae bacterium]
MPLSNRGEFALIDQWADILSSAESSKVLLGIGDDAACLADLRSPVFSCDALIENVHFRHEWITPRQLGWKAMAVNVSDMAAMGASPIAVTVSLALPPQTETVWVEELYRGFADAARKFEFAIVGGDTTKANQVMISVAIIGELIAQKPLLRSNAKEGDAILVTGTLGESAAGLALLQSNKIVQTPFEKYCVEKHLLPQPRIQEIRAALELKKSVHAAIDISDGIAGDAAHIAEKSQLDLIIDVAQIPISQHCKNAAQVLNADALQWALAGGEDYELLICVDPNAADDVIEKIQSFSKTPVKRVGFCRKPESVTAKVLLQNKGKTMPLPQSWRHF